MFQYLLGAFLFFWIVSGCFLWGAIMHIPIYNDREVWSELDFQKRLMDVKNAEAQARANRRMDIIQGDLKKVGDDFYRHLTLNAKRKR